MRHLLFQILVAATFATPAMAQLTSPIRVGVLTDETGPYADAGGAGSVAAARMAAADMGGTIAGQPIEIVHGDTLNKPDVASTIARRWFDTDGVSAVVDLPVTPIALAVQQLAREKNRTVMITGAAISEFTSKLCSPVSSHWADDTHALTTGTARALLEHGGKSWFFITVDMAFGAALQRDAAAIVTAGGGTVVGEAKHAIGATDYSSQVLQAQASGANVIAFASVGGDLVNLIKQAHEFGLGIDGKQTLGGFLIYITDINALGLAAAQGFELSSSFYWDQSDQSRAFAKRFMAEMHRVPSKEQAATYTAVLHYLQAVKQTASVDAVVVNKSMRNAPVDYFGHAATLRNDGRLMANITLYKIKTPNESKQPWDYYTPVQTIDPQDAFLPINPACNF
jgi:branched-chain amino acid transport system substrate-binding protein